MFSSKQSQAAVNLVAVAADFEKSESGVWAFLDDKGGVRDKGVYDKITPLVNVLLFHVRKKRKEALIKQDGSFLVPFEYDYILVNDNFEYGVALVKKGGKVGLIDLDGKLISWLENYKDNDLDPLEDLDVREGTIQFVALADNDDNDDDDEAEDEDEGEEKRGVMDFTGKITIKPGIYDYINSHENGFAGVTLGGKSGFIDLANELAIPIKFDVTGSFQANGLCFARMGEKKGLIDASGEFIFPSDYQIEVNDGCCVITVGAKSGLIDENRSYILPIEYESIGYSEPYFYAKKNGLYGLVTKDRGLIFDCRYERIGPFDEGRFIYTQGSKCGFVDENGSEIGTLPFETAIPTKFANETILRVKLNGKWGLADASGNILIKPEFDWDDMHLLPSMSGARFRKNGKWALTDSSLNFVSDYIYDSVEEGYQGFTVVGVRIGPKIEKYGLMSPSGVVLLEPSFDHIQTLN